MNTERLTPETDEAIRVTSAILGVKVSDLPLNGLCACSRKLETQRDEAREALRGLLVAMKWALPKANLSEQPDDFEGCVPWKVTPKMRQAEQAIATAEALLKGEKE